MKYAFAILVIACAIAAANADISAACQKCFDDTMAKACPNVHACPKGTDNGVMQMCKDTGECTPADLIEDGCMKEQTKATAGKFKDCVKQEAEQCNACDQGEKDKNSNKMCKVDCAAPCYQKMSWMGSDEKLITCFKGAMEHNKKLHSGEALRDCKAKNGDKEAICQKCLADTMSKLCAGEYDCSDLKANAEAQQKANVMCAGQCPKAQPDAKGPTDPCKANPCKKDVEICTNNKGKAQCLPNPCEPTPCGEYAVCNVNKEMKHECKCPKGMTGDPNKACGCEKDEFTCKSGGCIHMKYKCNGKPDCQDKSDELEGYGCPDPNSCDGHCGHRAPGGCWCDSVCHEEHYDDCCRDKVQACPASQ